MWCHKALGKSFQLFDTNWKKLSIDVSFCLKVFIAANYCMGKVDVVDLLWVSECFFCLLAPASPMIRWDQEACGERWGAGGGKVGSGGGYMAEFPRMLARDEKDKEILFF